MSLTTPLVQAIRHDPLRLAIRALALQPARVATAVAFGTGALGCAIGLMAVSAWLIARAAQQPPVMYLSMAVVATRAFGLGRGALRYCERLAGHDVALRGAVSARERLYARLAAGDPAAVASLHRGDLLARIGADIDALADVIVRGLLPFAVVWTTCLLTVLGLALVLPVAAVAVLAGAVVATVVAPWLVGRAAVAVERETAQVRAAVSAESLALLEGAEELAVAGAVPERLQRVSRLQERWATLSDDAARPASWAAGLSTLATAGAAVLALVAACAATGGGELSVVMLAVVALTALALAEAASGLPAAAVSVVAGRAAAQRLVRLLELEPAKHGRAAPPPAPATRTDPDADPEHDPGDMEPLLRAEGLSAGWPGRPAVHHDLDVRLGPGDALAVLGPSGSGKTTLLLTLAGLLAPAEGVLHLRGGALFTAEDAHVFGTTVRENLRLAAPGADDDDLAEALTRAGLGDWLAQLPDGLDTLIGSGGRDVSGGERRRLLVARGLLSPARVLLFDEPTEHLDPATADQLTADLAELAAREGRAVVLATHRLPAGPRWTIRSV